MLPRAKNDITLSNVDALWHTQGLVDVHESESLLQAFERKSAKRSPADQWPLPTEIHPRQLLEVQENLGASQHATAPENAGHHCPL